MALSGVDIFNAAADQAMAVSKNLQAIREARLKRQQEEEDRKLDIEEKNLKLKKLRQEGELSELQYKAFEAQFKEYQKQQNAIASGKDAMINQTEDEQLGMLKEADAIGEQALPVALAERLNPSLAVGPGGRMIQGFDSDNRPTPEATNPNPMEPVYHGGKITGYKQKPYKSPAQEEKKPSYDSVISLAKDMAKEDTSSIPLAEKIRKHLPEAKRILYGEQSPANSKGLPMDAVYKQDTVPNVAKKDKFGYTIGDIQETARGAVEYIGDNKWRLRKQ